MRVNLILITVAGWLVPRNLRSEWKREWQAEIWHHWNTRQQCQTNQIKTWLNFSNTTLGCFEDALWFQRNRLSGSLQQDIKDTFLDLARHPISTTLVVSSLALTIGLIVVLYTVFDSIFIKSLPFENPNQLVFIGQQDKSGDLPEMSPANFLDVTERSGVLEKSAAFRPYGLNISAGGESRRISGTMISPDFFSVLGVYPLYQNKLQTNPQVTEANRKVILSYSLWQEYFNSDEKLIGKTIQLSGVEFEVGGVMPPNFDFPKGSGLWFFTTGKAPTLSLASDENDVRGLRFFSVISRLKRNVSESEAQANLDIVAQNLEAKYPVENKNMKINLVSLNEYFFRDDRPIIIIFLLVVSSVFFILCLNISKLFPKEEFSSIYTKQKISKVANYKHHHIKRQLLRYTLPSIVSGVIGIYLISTVGNSVFLLSSNGFDLIDKIKIGYGEIAASFTLALLAGLLCSLLPILGYARFRDKRKLVSPEICTAPRNKSQILVKVLAVMEIAMVLFLMCGAVLMIRRLSDLTSENSGIKADNVLTMRIALPEIDYENNLKTSAFFTELLKHINKVEGVQAVSIANDAPMTGGSRLSFKVEETEKEYTAGYKVISKDYQQVLGIPLKQGRVFTEQDISDETSAILINESLARQLWADKNPLGQRIRFGNTPIWHEIVGVIGDVKYQGLQSEPIPEVFLPYPADPWHKTSILIHTAGTLNPIENVKSEIWTIDQRVAIYNIQPMQKLISDSIFSIVLLTYLMIISAGTSVILLLLGYQSVKRNSIKHRKQLLFPTSQK